jgi:hypothetical protein
MSVTYIPERNLVRATLEGVAELSYDKSYNIVDFKYGTDKWISLDGTDVSGIIGEDRMVMFKKLAIEILKHQPSIFLLKVQSQNVSC